MPMYDFVCEKDGKFEKFFSIARVPGETPCGKCGEEAKRVLFYSFGIYGTTKFHDKAFADASEAMGKPIQSTKEIDALEKAGEIRAITNPSRHRKYKDKK